MALPPLPGCGRSQTPNYWKFVCKLDWGRFVEAQEQSPEHEDLQKWVGDLKAKYGPTENWPDIGCGAPIQAMVQGLNGG